MKKILFLILCLFASIQVANATSISDINMDIELDKEGNATITETWKANVTQGTEGWHPYYNLGDSTIQVLTASMDGKRYTVLDNWNESASLSSKAYKAGIYNPSGRETDVVFGVSEYGSHSYQVVYRISNFVKATTDADMIYWQLFPYNFSAAPGNVSIKISGPTYYPDDTDVWGFGMYGAPCYVANGSIYMTSDNKRVGSSEYLTLLAKFPSGTFNTYSRLDNDFNHYLTMAQKGTEVYKESKLSNDVANIIFGAIAVVFQAAIWIVVAMVCIRSANKNKINYDFGPEGKELGDVNNFRDIPCKKDVYRAFWVANTYGLNKSANDFMGVLLLKWIWAGNVTVETLEEKKLFKDKKQDIIVFNNEPADANEYERNLYRYMLEASGDGKLEKDEFKKWCNKHYSKILGWADKVLKYEKDELVKEGDLTETTIQKGLIFKYNVKGYIISDKLRQEAIEMKGLRKFLKEFSQISKKEPIEVKLWDQYLMYAQIFGIAEQVMKKFKDLYPEIIDNMEQTNFSYGTFMFINSVSSTGINAATSARSAAQSYSGGGGGFSSGGGGGGSFGGGGGGGGFR